LICDGIKGRRDCWALLDADAAGAGVFMLTCDGIKNKACSFADPCEYFVVGIKEKDCSSGMMMNTRETTRQVNRENHGRCAAKLISSISSDKEIDLTQQEQTLLGLVVKLYATRVYLA
jgi:hypothetical protein